MKFHWTMPGSVREHFAKEILASSHARAYHDLHLEWHHLERAHILAQRWPREHCAVHWRMLKFGIRIKNTGEVIGQLPRLIFGGVKSFVGTVPIGNTGGTNVPPMRRMRIPEDLARVLNM